MPELPEVETVRVQLEKKVKGLVVESVSKSKLNLRKPLSCSTKKVKGDKISSLSRWGKRLFIHLDSNKYFDVSLGMTGSFRVESLKNKKFLKHDHVKLNFKNGLRLVYNDPRRFGWFSLEEGEPTLQGWDPFLSATRDFKKIVEKASIKEVSAYSFLMDQKNIVGLGNIYVQEILFFSKISPFRKIKECTESEMRLIRKFTKKVLKQSLDHGGSTILNYKNTDGESGSFQNKFQVYGKKKDEFCRVCKSKVIYEQSSRAIYYCPSCQK